MHPYNFYSLVLFVSSPLNKELFKDLKSPILFLVLLFLLAALP